jgi:hypothetical protein
MMVLNNRLRTAATIALLGVVLPVVATPSQAQDLAGGFRLTKTETSASADDVINDKIALEAAPASLPNNKSGLVPPVPEPGTLAILIAGLGMILIAQRRQLAAS